jgi:hypothetical protein
VLADGGVENVNAQVDALIETGVLRRLLAFTELKFSNSMIEAWWRSLKHQWLFLHPLESVATVRRLVAFYVDEHNHVLPPLGLSRTDTRRDVLWYRRRGAGGLEVARSRRAPGSRRRQPIRVVPGVPVTKRRRLTRAADGCCKCEPVRLEVIAERTPPRASYERADRFQNPLTVFTDGASPS